MPWTAVAPNSGRSMTTSSSEGNRCTRISPSAVLDDRLDGKDLEWARDHLRRCEACRDRDADFREMLLRVRRLPSGSDRTGTRLNSSHLVISYAVFCLQ